LNPFSLVKLFKDAKFSRFWRNTSPALTLLTGVVEATPDNFLPGQINGLPAQDYLVSFVENPPTIATLFHTGYLTRDSVTGPSKNEIFNFKIPNEEIKDDLFKVLVEIMFAKKVKDKEAETTAIRSAIIQREAISLTGILNAFYSGLVHKHPIQTMNHFITLCSGLTAKVCLSG
jgi:hypothetical protein